MSLPKLGFLTWSDWQGPTAFSGSPWSARTALERLGHEVVDIDVGPFHNSSRKIAHQHGSQAMAVQVLLSRLQRSTARGASAGTH